jgi:hypothetical protein
MKWRVGLAFAALCVIWGLPYFFIKLALVEIPPVGVAWAPSGKQPDALQ